MERRSRRRPGDFAATPVHRTARKQATMCTTCIHSQRARRSMARYIATGRRCGFTLIELLVVLSIIATLLMIAVPRYFHSLERSKEAVLRQDLSVLRDAID